MEPETTGQQAEPHHPSVGILEILSAFFPQLRVVDLIDDVTGDARSACLVNGAVCQPSSREAQLPSVLNWS